MALEHPVPGAGAHHFPANPHDPQVQKALAYNHLTTVPSNWVTDGEGKLRTLDPDGTLGPLVSVGPEIKPSIWNELLHASPYIGAAIGMGAIPMALGGAGAAVPAASTATGAVGAGSTLGMSSALPGALSTVGGAGAGAAGAGTAAGVGSWIQRGLKGAQGVSDVLGGAADRAERSNAIRDELALAASRAKLGQSEFATTAPAERLRTSLKAAMAKHATPTSVSWGGPGSGLRGELPQFSGGVKSAITAGQQEPGTSDLMNNIIQDQAAAQKRGGITGGGTDYDPGLGSDFGKSSGLDKAVGAGAFGSSILAALGKSGVLDRYRSPQAQPLNIPDTWVGGY